MIHHGSHQDGRNRYPKRQPKHLRAFQRACQAPIQQQPLHPGLTQIRMRRVQFPRPITSHAEIQSRLSRSLTRHRPRLLLPRPARNEATPGSLLRTTRKALTMSSMHGFDLCRRETNQITLIGRIQQADQICMLRTTRKLLLNHPSPYGVV